MDCLDYCPDHATVAHPLRDDCGCPSKRALCRECSIAAEPKLTLCASSRPQSMETRPPSECASARAARPASRAQGAPTLERRAASHLEQLLQRVRAGGRVDDDVLVGLAWDYFAAGFAAREATPVAEALQINEEPRLEASESNSSRLLADLVSTLTPRRLEVLRLVAKGLTNREIGNVLGISSYTVKAHIAGVLETLDLTNRTEAAVALREYEAECTTALH